MENNTWSIISATKRVMTITAWVEIRSGEMQEAGINGIGGGLSVEGGGRAGVERAVGLRHPPLDRPWSHAHR